MVCPPKPSPPNRGEHRGGEWLASTGLRGGPPGTRRGGAQSGEETWGKSRDAKIGSWYVCDIYIYIYICMYMTIMILYVILYFFSVCVCPYVFDLIWLRHCHVDHVDRSSSSERNDEAEFVSSRVWETQKLLNKPWKCGDDARLCCPDFRRSPIAIFIENNTKNHQNLRDCHHPNWKLICFRGVGQPPTRFRVIRAIWHWFPTVPWISLGSPSGQGKDWKGHCWCAEAGRVGRHPEKSSTEG